MERPGVVIVVEEHATVLAAILRRVHGPDHRRVPLRAFDHDAPFRPADLAEASVVLVSALRHPRAQDRDPSLPLLAGPEVVARVRAQGYAGPVIVYGSRVCWPEVTIAAHQAGATALVGERTLLAQLPALLRGAPIEGTLPPPTAQDFAHLGLPPDARVWDAIARMRRIRHRDTYPHGDAWERVAQTDPARKIDDRTREYINDRVAPLLGITTGRARHRRVADLIARIVGLPAQRSVRDDAEFEVAAR